MYTTEHVLKDLKYLQLLSQNYPTIQAASTEVINLSAILNLPKGTEHFISDIHGEYEVFLHIVKNASGSIKRKIESCFARSITNEEKDLLATLIYYPVEKLSEQAQKGYCDEEWYRTILIRLVMVCRVVTSKYTRSKVRKALPEDFRYIIDELMYTDNFEINKQEYFDNILNTLIDIGRADSFIIELSTLIQKMIIDRLHIIGDIFDRGSGAHLVMDHLSNIENIDIQWGNHDIVWMAASLGHGASIANVIRNSIRYNNFSCLEEGYGLNIRPLAVFALEQYRDDPCTHFKPKYDKESSKNNIELSNIELATKVHKAITIIQLKLEGQIITHRPEFNMDSRLALRSIDYEKGTVVIDGITYELNDTNFPTVDPKNPHELTDGEKLVMQQLQNSFINNKALEKHVDFLFKKGSMYRVYNDNLLYHGCIPMDNDGSFSIFKYKDEEYSGKSYLDFCDKVCRQAGYGYGKDKLFGMDFMWFLWCGENSPLNGKKKMTTFERAFIDDKSSWEEPKDHYYDNIESRTAVELILREFNITSRRSHIVNGHVPVKITKGESPLKAGGKLLVIDGGISKAYQAVTGISGYTLISNSYQLLISEHQPFTGIDAVINDNNDMHSKNITVEDYKQRITIENTDSGLAISNRINNLKLLLYAYRNGIIEQAQ